MLGSLEPKVFEKKARLLKKIQRGRPLETRVKLMHEKRLAADSSARPAAVLAVQFTLVN